jgi:hypothetical protein
MSELHEKRKQEVALFRYGVIADLVPLPPGTRRLYLRITGKAEKTWAIPHSRKTRLAPETIRHWLKRYRKGGFDALMPKGRADAGSSRRIPRTVADRLLCIKE